MYDDLKKKVVIAGASKGIGLAIAKKYIFEGYETILLSRTAPKKIQKKFLLVSNRFNKRKAS